jgi:hypothetical protein
MGYHNFAGRGYTVLAPFQPGEYWDLGGSAWITFDVGDVAANRCTMRFTRPRTTADRVQTAMGISLDSPPEGEAMSRGAAFAVALVNFFNVANALTSPQPVSRDVNVLGLGYDDGHAGSRERHRDQFDQAVSDLGRGWLSRYKDKLGWGGFFTDARDWHTRGALASEFDVMILRLDDALTNLEISSFYLDRRARVCRLVQGYAVRRGPQLVQGH